MPTKQIGFDRFLELAWLDATAAKVASGASVEEVRDYLWGLLDGILSGDSERSGRHKTITVLTRIWCPDPGTPSRLHALAVRKIADATPESRLALHWALSMAAYPFFADEVSQIGRLIMLQGDVSLAHLNRRMTETYGDRDSVRGGVRRVVRSLVRWGVLADTSEKGVYRTTSSVSIDDADVAEVLLHAVIQASDQDVLDLDKISNHPALFPFRIDHQALRIASMDSLEERREFDGTYVRIRPATDESAIDA